MVAVSYAWYLKRIHTRVCRTPFWTHISDILVGTYSVLFEHWESIPPEIQKKILAIHIDRIDKIKGRDQKAPAATRWDPEMVIDDEDV
jgi:hypothetical protein